MLLIPIRVRVAVATLTLIGLSSTLVLENANKALQNCSSIGISGTKEGEDGGRYGEMIRELIPQIVAVRPADMSQVLLPEYLLH